MVQTMTPLHHVHISFCWTFPVLVTKLVYGLYCACEHGLNITAATIVQLLQLQMTSYALSTSVSLVNPVSVMSYVFLFCQFYFH